MIYKNYPKHFADNSPIHWLICLLWDITEKEKKKTLDNSQNWWSQISDKQVRIDANKILLMVILSSHIQTKSKVKWLQMWNPPADWYPHDIQLNDRYQKDKHSVSTKLSKQEGQKTMTSC